MPAGDGGSFGFLVKRFRLNFISKDVWSVGALIDRKLHKNIPDGAIVRSEVHGQELATPDNDALN